MKQIDTKKLISYFFLIVMLGLFLASCQGSSGKDGAPGASGAAGATGPAGPDGTDGVEVTGYIGGHGDKTAEAFIHWDEDGEISTSCAKCHSEGGFLDYIGADGTASGTVEVAAEIGKALTCTTCHNGTVKEIEEVKLVASDLTIDENWNRGALDNSKPCLVCHQGREAKASVDEYLVEKDATTDLDAATTGSFRNVHYFPAAGTMMGHWGQVGYEYDGMSYDGRLAHVTERDSCVECHDQHTTEVKKDVCYTCHADATDDTLGFGIIRMFGSTGDYDGDGSETEGIKQEIDGLAVILYSAIQAYATNVAGAGIVYDASSYPYWFGDTDGDGVTDSGEASYSNSYSSWTGRLIQATFNYQLYKKDPGAYAHNPKYVIQLMHDSIDDLNGQLAGNAVAFTGDRDDGGHFNGADPGFGYHYFNGMDHTGKVRSGCEQCHSSGGYRDYVINGDADSLGTGHFATNGLTCATCHDKVGEDYSDLIDIAASVTFPGSITTAVDTAADRICMQCHTGRENMATLEADIAASDIAADGTGNIPTTDGAVNEFSWPNPHYFQAAATLLGTNGGTKTGGWEYAAMTYPGKFGTTGRAADANHTTVGDKDNCTFCHAPITTKHSMDVLTDNAAACSGCHSGASALSAIETRNKGILDDLGTQLYTAIQAYATATAGVDDIVYTDNYPYWGKAAGGSYATWTQKLAKAAFNYKMYKAESGAWAHNVQYMGDLLHTSITDLGATPAAVTGFTPSN